MGESKRFNPKGKSRKPKSAKLVKSYRTFMQSGPNSPQLGIIFSQNFVRNQRVIRLTLKQVQQIFFKLQPIKFICFFNTISEQNLIHSDEVTKKAQNVCRRLNQRLPKRIKQSRLLK